MKKLSEIVTFFLMILFASNIYASDSIEGKKLDKYIKAFNLGEPCEQGIQKNKPCHLSITNSFKALETRIHTVFSELDFPIGDYGDELVCKTALTIGGKLAYADISILKRGENNLSHIYSNKFHIEKGEHDTELQIACIEEGAGYVVMLDHNTLFQLKISSLGDAREFRNFANQEHRSLLDHKSASI